MLLQSNKTLNGSRFEFLSNTYENVMQPWTKFYSYPYDYQTRSTRRSWQAVLVKMTKFGDIAKKPDRNISMGELGLEQLLF